MEDERKRIRGGAVADKESGAGDVRKSRLSRGDRSEGENRGLRRESERPGWAWADDKMAA
ncbi:hypothetical protein HAX54_053018, partial [Datura stramonium]|nr:hypothetical protein [Datura stramonium]